MGHVERASEESAKAAHKERSPWTVKKQHFHVITVSGPAPEGPAIRTLRASAASVATSTKRTFANTAQRSGRRHDLLFRLLRSDGVSRPAVPYLAGHQAVA